MSMHPVGMVGKKSNNFCFAIGMKKSNRDEMFKMEDVHWKPSLCLFNPHTSEKKKDHSNPWITNSVHIKSIPTQIWFIHITIIIIIIHSTLDLFTVARGTWYMEYVRTFAFVSLCNRWLSETEPASGCKWIVNVSKNKSFAINPNNND